MSAVDEAQWHAWRAGADLPDGCAVTASAIARAASGRYGGAYSVVAEHLGLVGRTGSNERIARGHALEVRVTTAAEQLTGLHIVGEQTMAQHPQRPELRATLDGMAAPVAAPTIDDVSHIVEVKTRGADVRPAFDYWNPQIQFQMLVTGIPKALLAEAIVRDTDEGPVVIGLRLHEIEADELTQLSLLDLADELLAHMRAGTLPTPDAGALDVVKSVMHETVADADTVDLSPVADEVRRLGEIRSAERAAKKEADGIEARLRDAIGHATHGVCPGFKVTVSRPRMVVTPDAEAELLAAHPELAKTVLDRDLAKKTARSLYEEARQPVGARTLTVKEVNE